MRARLSFVELFALFLRSGVLGCNFLELSAKLKRAAGSLANLARMEASEIAQLCRGIGPANAATLAAVFELGQRAVQEELHGRDMREAQNVYDYLAPDLRFEPQENLIALFLDANHRLIRRAHISKGTLSRVSVHPRDVFREALRANAAFVVLAHNHPSGDPKPSKADRQMTLELTECGEMLGIRIINHIIIGAPSAQRDKPYYSFAHDEPFLT